MNTSAISHRSAYTDCYALNADEIIVNLRTGKDVTSVEIIHDDPFAHGCMGHKPWYGTPAVMERRWNLKHNDIWSIKLRPDFKREQYYFSITAGSETLLMFEDGFYTPEEANKPGRLKQYFKFPWLNPADVIVPPAWVNDTVWYQIMPDRFRRGNTTPKRMPLRKWTDSGTMTPFDYYGGDLRGITEKLPYLQDLGITGIYLTPIFLSNSNHKYNTFSYETIDPDFGTEEDLAELVETAHSLGIRVMLDAVFNHCGSEFAPWVDACKNGPESPYFDWFFINKWPLPPLSRLNWKTDDGRFYTFAFGAMMPKINTNRPEVIRYFTQRCKYWVETWHIDGIRFDVGNEISHTFLKHLNRELKQVNPEIFLLGELWHDGTQWLQGDEYDSVMNYPFMESLNNFWLDGRNPRDMIHAMDRCYSLYPEQINHVLFNFLDTHDTMRALTRCGNLDIFYQQLALLMTLPGSACIYYGTEIAMEGGDDPDCRRPMPWTQIEAGECDIPLKEMKALISLRKAHPQLRRGEIQWCCTDNAPIVRYRRKLPGCTTLTVTLNTSDQPIPIGESPKIRYSRKLDGNLLLPGGIAVTE